jgi:D-glycero-alpha-D-manno-heptose 1-phosphate guanylyltransferase
MKEAIVLAGGFGSRLKELTKDIPKCMLLINEKPFLFYIITYLKNNGINRIILSLGFKSEIVIDYIKQNNFGVEFIYIIEDQPLGTGGALKLALSKSINKNTLIVNGDSLFTIDLKVFLNFHELKNSKFSIALHRIQENDRFGIVEVDQNDEIVSFKEKMKSTDILINSGFYIISNKNLLDTYPETFSLEKDFFENKFKGVKLFAKEFDGKFIDIGIPNDFTFASEFVNKYY